MTTPIVQCTDTSPAENETGDTLIKVFSPIEVFVTVSVIVYANVNLGLCTLHSRLETHRHSAVPDTRDPGL
jgi:hypothetical protein